MNGIAVGSDADGNVEYQTALLACSRRPMGNARLQNNSLHATHTCIQYRTLYIQQHPTPPLVSNFFSMPSGQLSMTSTPLQRRVYEISSFSFQFHDARLYVPCRIHYNMSGMHMHMYSSVRRNRCPNPRVMSWRHSRVSDGSYGILRHGPGGPPRPRMKYGER